MPKRVVAILVPAFLVAVFLVLVTTAVAQRAIVPVSVRSLPARDKRWALLVGVNDYGRNSGISPLYGAANDAVKMKPVLIKYAGFPEDQVRVLASGSKDNIEPTRANFITELSNILHQIPKDGMLLVQFSGHGIERGGQPFLLAQDSRLSDDLRVTQLTSISVREIQEMVQEAGIAQVLFLLDACRNDPNAAKKGDGTNAMSQGFANAFRFDRRNEGVHAFATIFATEVGARAWENQTRERGYFSAAVEEALTGKAANPANGEVTLDSLLNYVQARVPKQVAAEMGKGNVQRPWPVVAGYAGDFVLAVAPEAVVGPKPPDEVAMWREVEKSGNCGAWTQFVTEFGAGRFGPAARIRMAAACTVPVAPTLSGSVAPTVGAARTKVNPIDGLTYVRIDPGTFTMGCSPGDKECDSDEMPAHKVTISKEFWLGQTEVTQEAYQKVMGSNPSYFKGDKLRPVESVSWNDADAYCRKIGGRLPTEAEWEYAARAGTTGSRYDTLDAVAWSDKNSGAKTHPVAGLTANPWRLYDMLGNVWEWVADWYADKYASGNATDPKGPASGQLRALRGGSWDDLPAVVRASNRDWNVPAGRDGVIGFRCVGE